MAPSAMRSEPQTTAVQPFPISRVAALSPPSTENMVRSMRSSTSSRPSSDFIEFRKPAILRMTGT